MDIQKVNDEFVPWLLLCIQRHVLNSSYIFNRSATYRAEHSQWLGVFLCVGTCLPWSLKNSPALSITCSSVRFEYGCSLQTLNISHRVTPNAHTSLAVVNLPLERTNHTDKHSIFDIIISFSINMIIRIMILMIYIINDLSFGFYRCFFVNMALLIVFHFIFLIGKSLLISVPESSTHCSLRNYMQINKPRAH